MNEQSNGMPEFERNRSLLQPRDRFRVSSKSIWTDPIWHLDTESPGRRERINWSFELPDGSRSTDPKHSALLEGFRETFWGMLHDGGWYGKKLHVGGSGPFGVGMRELFIWLVWRGDRTFAALNDTEQNAYLEDLPVLILDRQSFYGRSVVKLSEDNEYAEHKFDIDDGSVSERRDMEDAVVDGMLDQENEADESLTYHQVYIRLNLLYYVYAQGSVLERQGIDSMPVEPFFGARVGVQVNTIARHIQKITPPLPDEVALPLLKSVTVWIYHRSIEILELQDKYMFLKEQLIQRKCPEESVKNNLAELLAQHQFGCDPGDEVRWHSSLEEWASNDFRRLLLRMRDACVLALEYFVGMRMSEICSIKHGPRREDGLPSCIVIKYSKSGLMELFFVNGLLSKGKQIPVAEQWLIGCRPVGSLELPPAVQAIVVLDRLFAPWRNTKSFDALIGGFTNPHSLPWRATAENALSLSLLKGKRRFFAHWVDLSALPDFNERGENLALYRETKGACIRSHHGRKTFASYVLEIRTSLLVAVSRHFKHMNTAITESNYFSPITRLRQEAESARSAATVAFFVEVLEGRKVFGRMAEVVYKFFGTTDWQSIRNKVEMFKKVEELVEVHGLQMYFSNHGNCMIRSNPLESRCWMSDTAVSWVNNSPQYSARSPGLCSGCGCNLMDASHLPFWRSRAAMRFEDDDGKQEEFRVQVFRREQAKKVVQALEGGHV